MAAALPMKLRDWIPESKINWFGLSTNPNAIPILEQNPDKISWNGLSMNPNAIHLLEKQINHCNKNICVKLCCYLFDNYNWKCYKDINLYNLSGNPNAIPILEKYPKLINWVSLSENPNAIHILEKNINKIHWDRLSLNPNAIHLLEHNLDKIDWRMLSQNPNAIRLLEKNPEKIDWDMLSKNPNAIHLLKQNPDKINWKFLSENPNAMDLIEKNIDLIQRSSPFVVIYLCCNKNPYIMNIIKKKQHLINTGLYELCSNPNAMDILKTKIDKIFKNYFCMSIFYGNPAIFEIDYAAMRENHKALKEELIQRAWHPSRVAKWLDAGVDLEDL